MKSVLKKKPTTRKLDLADLPKYCDFNCPHASFAPDDVVGACRRELAIYCNLIAKYNNKNSRCAAKEHKFS
jgi:hypothetical protein